MAKCVQCGAATVLYVNGVPLCTDCDYRRERQDKPMPDRSDKFGQKSAS